MLNFSRNDTLLKINIQIEVQMFGLNLLKVCECEYVERVFLGTQLLHGSLHLHFEGNHSRRKQAPQLELLALV